MSDYISREAAIDRLNKNLSACNPGTFSEMCYADAIETVKHLPSADVEPVRNGKWNIRVSDERTLCLECSVCGRKVDNFNLHRLLISGEYGEACRRYPYCHCGAKMCLEEDTCEM
nr:MAG TPA: hypothetical protein [Caudoviricetes sp.]